VSGGLSLLAFAHETVRSQEPALPSATAASPVRPKLSVEDIAERLRVLEARNRDLVEQLDQTRRMSEESRRV
jgi:hypothetical protein